MNALGHHHRQAAHAQRNVISNLQREEQTRSRGFQAALGPRVTSGFVIVPPVRVQCAVWPAKTPGGTVTRQAPRPGTSTVKHAAGPESFWHLDGHQRAHGHVVRIRLGPDHRRSIIDGVRTECASGADAHPMSMTTKPECIPRRPRMAP